MAFNPDRLSLIVQPLGDAGMRIYNYQSDDVQTTITGTGYFEEATKRGLRPFDIIFVSPISGTTEPFIVNIDSIDSDGNATGAMTIAPALNPDNGLTNLSTSASQTFDKGFFGGQFESRRSANVDELVIEGTYSGPRFTRAITMETTGENPNGPDRAHGPLWLLSKKTDYLTSTEVGEVDGLYTVVIQGANGDASAFLAGVYKVENTTYGSTGAEMSMNVINTSGTVTRSFKAVLGGNLNATDARGGGFGFMVRPNGDGYSLEHGVLVLGYSSASSTGVKTAIRCSSTLATANTYFLVTGDEDADGGGLVRAAAGTAAVPTYSFVAQASTGFFSNGTSTIGVSAAGTVVANLGPDGVRIGTGLADMGVGTLNVKTAYYLNGNLRINVNGMPVLPVYTVATLPATGSFNQYGMIFVSDGTSNKRVAVSDGTNWRFPDGNIVS